MKPSVDEIRDAVAPPAAVVRTGGTSAANARAKRAAALKAKAKGPEETSAKGPEKAKASEEAKAKAKAKAKSPQLAARAARAHRIAVRREKAARASGDGPPASKQ